MSTTTTTIKSSDHDARYVADYIIRKGIERGTPYTPFSVIKLVYLAHGWLLGLYDRALFAQTVRAWEYGPVITDVFDSLKGRGDTPIMEPLKSRAPASTLDKHEANVIDQVLKVYEEFSGAQLSAITHQDGTPWHKIWYEQGKDAIIPNTLVREHFAELSKKRSR